MRTRRIPGQSRKGRGARKERNSCGDKVQYPTREDAIRAAHKIAAKTGARPLWAYRCAFCMLNGARAWHLGHR